MDISRFYSPQRTDFNAALQEIRSGRKRSHWMWYIFPQIKGLGKTETSKFYAIQDLQEAKAFLKDDFLGENLRQISTELLNVRGRTASEIFGFPDDRKLQSSMTLFAAADRQTGNIFEQVIDKYFGGQKCAFTESALAEKL